MRPINNPECCLVHIATHLLVHRLTVEESVLNAFKIYCKRGDIFHAAAFMLPYCRHPMFRHVKTYLQQLVYPFVVPRDELVSSLCDMNSLSSVQRYIAMTSELPEQVVLLWLLVHKHMKISMLKEILLTGVLVYR